MTTLRFHGSAAVLLLPLALFVAVTARLFISEAAFDLTGLAAAGVLTLFSGSLLAKAPSEYWKAAVRGASSELTGTVVLILIASGIFSAMMKASGVADGLVFLGGMLHLTGHAFTVFVLLASSLMAAATGSSIGTLLAAMPIFFPAGVALGADPAMLAGAVLSGAIFGDNLAPVSDVTVISSVTQRFRNGTPADIAGVVRTRLPYAMIALAVSLPVYAFMGESLPVSEAALSGDASALLMLVPVAVLIAVAAAIITSRSSGLPSGVSQGSGGSSVSAASCSCLTAVLLACGMARPLPTQTPPSASRARTSAANTAVSVRLSVPSSSVTICCTAPVSESARWRSATQSGRR